MLNGQLACADVTVLAEKATRYPLLEILREFNKVASSVQQYVIGSSTMVAVNFVNERHDVFLSILIKYSFEYFDCLDINIVCEREDSLNAKAAIYTPGQN